MNADWTHAAALLPDALTQYLAVHLGWAVALACALLWLARRAGYRGLRVAGAGLALLLALLLAWCLLPGPQSPAHWLGLAFQAPSLSSALLCLWYLQRRARDLPPAGEQPAGLLALCVAGVLIGWLLLLDMLALLPWSLYAWGFDPLATGALLLAGLLPWLLQGRSALRDGRTWIAPLAICLFVLTRAPSGNAWDAVLDPWLWLGLQWVTVRRLRRARLR